MKENMQRGYQTWNAPLSGNRNRSGKETKVKSADTHPYLKDSFWANEVNHFWENGMYSEESKEYFRNCLRNAKF